METKKIDVYEFDERFYQRIVDGEIVCRPSVTYKLGLAAPTPFGLMQWRGEVGNQRAAEILREAGDFGSYIHDAIDKLIKGGKVSSDQFRVFSPRQSLRALKCMQGFCEWVEEYKPKFLANEYIIWNDEYNYAGTVDLKCEIDGEVMIVDFKTSKTVQDKHRMQIAAYAHADSVQKAAILHLGNTTKKGWSFLPVKDLPKSWEKFKAVNNVFEVHNPNVKPNTQVFPEYFKLG